MPSGRSRTSPATSTPPSYCSHKPCELIVSRVQLDCHLINPQKAFAQPRKEKSAVNAARNMPPRVPSVLSKQLCRSFSTTSRNAADHVRIVEVGPRDGLQNEKSTIPLETKLELIRRLAQTGVQTMEAGSFVPAKWVPQVSSDLWC